MLGDGCCGRRGVLGSLHLKGSLSGIRSGSDVSFYEDEQGRLGTPAEDLIIARGGPVEVAKIRLR